MSSHSAAAALALATLLAAQPAPPTPTSGWLVIAGPRGGCETTRTYDLSTGAAFGIDTCAGQPRVRTGTVPEAALREVMRLLMQRGNTRSGDTPRDRDSRPPQTTLTWLWVGGDGRLLIGDVTWPWSANAEEDRAAAQLAGLDAQWTEGCAPAQPPSNTALIASVPVMVNPVSADASQELVRAYRDARPLWEARPPCAR